MFVFADSINSFIVGTIVLGRSGTSILVIFIPDDNLEITRDTSPIPAPIIAGAQGLLLIVFEKQANTAN